MLGVAYKVVVGSPDLVPIGGSCFSAFLRVGAEWAPARCRLRSKLLALSHESRRAGGRPREQLHRAGDRMGLHPRVVQPDDQV